MSVRPWTAALLACWISIVMAPPSGPSVAAAQESPPSDQSPGLGTIPVDGTGLATGPYAVMETLSERTIFQLDVLRLTIRFGPETAADLERLAAGRDYGELLAEQVVQTAVASTNVLVRVRFLRDVGFERLMEGVGENLENALEGGFLSASGRDALLPRIEAQYEPIRDRGIREGDTTWYRIRGERFHVVLQSRDGATLLDRASEGSVHRRALLGGYLAPESENREGLVRSLFESDDE